MTIPALSSDVVLSLTDLAVTPLIPFFTSMLFSLAVLPLCLSSPLPTSLLTGVHVVQKFCYALCWPPIPAMLGILTMRYRLLHGLCNQISSSTHSSVVRGHVEFLSLGSFLCDEKLVRLSVTLGVPRKRLDYWQMRCRTS